MNKNRITALYIRVSTDAQAEEGYSIEAQQEMLEGYCKSKQIENYEFYIDGGFSGSNIERPEITRLIGDIKEKKIQAVVVYKLDRLSRSQKDTLFLIEDVLNPNGTEFVSLNENLDTSTSIGRAMLGIMSAFAQLERETIRERTRMGMKKRVESGLWMGGGKIPFGFDYDQSKGKLIPNRDAEKVRKIYDLYISGHSSGYIASALGMKYDRLIIQILKRRLNYGAIEYKGEIYENCHEPIVNKEIFDRAMEEMKRRSRVKAPTTPYLLTGLLYCGICGAKLRYQKWGKSATKIVCYSRQKSKGYLVKNPECTLPYFDSEEIEGYVLKDIFKVKTANIKPHKSTREDLLKVLQMQYDAECKALKRLYELYSKSGDFILLETIENTKENIKILNEKISNEKRLGEITKQNQKILDELTNIESLWKYMSIKDRQQFIRSVIEKIILYPTRIEVVYRI